MGVMDAICDMRSQFLTFAWLEAGRGEMRRGMVNVGMHKNHVTDRWQMDDPALQPYSRPMMTHYVIVESVCRNSIVVDSMTKLASSHLLTQIISKTFLMPDRGF